MRFLHIAVFAVCFFNSSFFHYMHTFCRTTYHPLPPPTSPTSYHWKHAFTNMLNHYKNIYNITLTQIALKLECVILMRIKSTTIAHVQPFPLSLVLFSWNGIRFISNVFFLGGLALFLRIHSIHFVCFNRS